MGFKVSWGLGLGGDMCSRVRGSCNKQEKAEGLCCSFKFTMATTVAERLLAP